MAVAALLTLMGVGALLTWAATRGLLGPTVRLGFGVLAAIALAVVGMRLRARGAARFGNTLLALALAVVHVDAWGAGPYLELVPGGVALAVAAVASAALAALALADGEELLFDVGVGGALAAPFVTSAGEGNVIVLLAYGLVVIVAALVALRPREWRLAPRLLLVGAAVYAGAALGPAFTRREPWYRADAAALFALLCAWGAWALGAAERRSGYALRFVIVALPALLAAGTRARALPDVALVAAAATLSAFAMVRGAVMSRGDGWLGGAVLPVGFLAAALAALADAWSARGGAVAGAWTAAALAMAYADRLDRRGVHLAGAALMAGIAALLPLRDHELACVAALAAHAVIFALIARRERTPEPLAPVLGALLVATIMAFDLLGRRASYAYTPFIGSASAAALLAVVAWLAVGRVAGGPAPAAPAEQAPGSDIVRASRAFAIAGAVVALLWGRQELARAWSRDLATFLLIAYYALAGVAAIHIGRWRSLPLARRAGLALALYAAAKAVVQASGLTAIGLKVGSYLLVGCFLLGVAYWYRSTAEPDAAPARG